MNEDIARFFTAYERKFNQALKDPSRRELCGMARAFAPYFVESGPTGVRGGKPGSLFRRQLPLGLRQSRRIGTQKLTVASLDVNALDYRNALARVRWRSVLVPKDGLPRTILFEVVYLLTRVAGSPRIFAYVTGDEQRVLKQSGIS